MGYAALVGGGVVVAYAMTHPASAGSSPWYDGVFYSLRAAAFIGLMVGGAKYAFQFARAHMSEALRNVDRIHAISFGKFFLGMFGERMNENEIRRVFEHWNINTPSAFSNMEPGGIDPKLFESVERLIKAVGEISAGTAPVRGKGTARKKQEVKPSP